MKSHVKIILALENVVAAILVITVYVALSLEWYWLLLFLIFDLGALGYMWNKHVGAHTYNLTHNLAIPGVLLLLYILFDGKILIVIALLWLLHIFIDRALGYGLKHYEGFEHTHLGTIGKAKK